MNNIKNIIKEIQSGFLISWNHKHTLLTLALATALVIPVAQSIAGDFIPETYANYQKSYATADPELIARTKQIHEEMLMTAFYYALQERSQEIGAMMNYDETEVKELLR